MAAPAELTLESFSGLIGERFEMRAAGAGAETLAVELCLSEAVALGEAAPGRRAPFSIVFSGPAASIQPQGTYRLEHETLGPIELFLVALQPDAAGARYEAVFN
jgi:hypothetical protein